MTLSTKNLRRIVHQHAEEQRLSIEKHTPVVSWLYPGQFTYCLNEEFIWDRYGSLIDCPEEVHFHKVQPVIRWDDLFNFYIRSPQGKIKAGWAHLGMFDMCTINGGHIVKKKDYERYSQQSLTGIISFLTEKLSLEPRKLEVGYFAGNALSKLCVTKQGKPKYGFEYTFPEDKESLGTLHSLGLEKTQVRADASRNSFLSPNWICGAEAPWGYRNEIYYRTSRGLVDIATVERLLWKPLYKEGDLVGIEEWDKAFVINGTGIERLALVANDLKNILYVDEIFPMWQYSKMRGYKNARTISESIRASHRIIADTQGDLTDAHSPSKSEDRKKKLNRILRQFNSIHEGDLYKMYEINAQCYSECYPELSGAIQQTVHEVLAYKERLQKAGVHDITF